MIAASVHQRPRQSLEPLQQRQYLRLLPFRRQFIEARQRIYIGSDNGIECRGSIGIHRGEQPAAEAHNLEIDLFWRHGGDGIGATAGYQSSIGAAS